MPRAYVLHEEKLLREIGKLPWLSFPAGLCELLVVFDYEDHPRNFRAYVFVDGAKRLLKDNLLGIDASLALIKAARCRGENYDLTTAYETEIGSVFERFERLRSSPVETQERELQKAYEVVRNHVLTAIDMRLSDSKKDGEAERLKKVCADLPSKLADVGEHHEPCFAEFDAWHHVALLQDLGRDLQKNLMG